MSNAEQFELFGRLLLALALGSLIGAEREYRGHEAGIRTSGLVCLGAAAFGELSHVLVTDRIAAGVVQGVGFLGAGLIFQREDVISGITTAATIWVLAGLGLFVSMRLWLVALLLTGLVILLLELSPLSDWVYRTGRRQAGERAARRRRIAAENRANRASRPPGDG